MELCASLAENPEFVEHIKDAYFDWPPLSHKTIADYLKSKATLTKLELEETLSQLDSKVSLALDAWTTRNNLAFLGMSFCNGKSNCASVDYSLPITLAMLMCVAITGRYIDQLFNLQQELLAFEPIEGQAKFFCVTTVL